MNITDWGDEKTINDIKKNYSLYISSGQILKIRTLFEVISNIILEDITINFTNDFIYIVKEHSNGGRMVYLKLETCFFEFFHIDFTNSLKNNNNSVNIWGAYDMSGNDSNELDGEYGSSSSSTTKEKRERILSMPISVSSQDLFKILKNGKNKSDTITLCVKNKNPEKLIVRIENSENMYVSEDILTILAYEEKPIVMPKEIEYPGSIIMPSADFQKNIKNLKAKSKKGLRKVVDITHNGGQMKFNYHDFCTITLGEAVMYKNGKDLYNKLTNTQVNNTKEDKGKNRNIMSMLDSKYKDQKEENLDENIIQGTFDLEYLAIFSKAVNLNSIMLIRIQNDMPLILEFKVGVLGSLYLLLNPIDE